MIRITWVFNKKFGVNNIQTELKKKKKYKTTEIIIFFFFFISRYSLNNDVRVSFYEETNTWLKEISKNKFHGGEEPDLSDLAVYGVLTAVEGCDAFQDLLTNTKVRSWFYNMKDAVHNHLGEKYLELRC